MTCDELNAMITGLSGQLGNLNQQISDKEAEIVAATPSCLSADTWSGTIPSAPLTQASVATRISQLQMICAMSPPNIQPAVMNTIAGYMAIQQKMNDKASLQTQAASVQAQLNQKIQEKQQQGCP